jgi:penicillin-binding protein 1A
MFGEEKLYTSGYSVRTTLDPQLQRKAREALREGLVRYDRKQGWRGSLTFEINQVKLSHVDPNGNWSAKLAEIPLCGPANPIPSGPVPRCVFSDLEPWRLGVVLSIDKDQAIVGLQPVKGAPGAPSKVSVPYAEMKWARTAAKTAEKPKAPKVEGAHDVLAPGQLIYVAPQSELGSEEAADKKAAAAAAAAAQNDPNRNWRLMQIPKIEGAIAVMDPHTGRVLALVGGFSFASSQFDRAMQAKRQPGSSFKPIVYAAALDNGYNPSSVMLDGPIAIDQGGTQGLWKVRNYDNKFGGASTLRVGIEKSRNAMTVRLAQDLGMPLVAEYAKRFGAYDELRPVLSMSLGAGETTLLRMTTAYCAFANGGKQVAATLIDRIQDRYGKVVWNYDKRKCDGCTAERWEGQDEPQLGDIRDQILDPITAYQMTSILQGVVDRGTGYSVSKVGKPLAGKTGTSNDEKDAWFVGFSPDLAAGVFVGFDTPTPMGKGETGGHIAAPIFRDFMKLALADKPAVPFRQPRDVKLVMVNAKTGARAIPGEQGAIWEAFKVSEEPPEPSEVAAYPGAAPEDPAAGTGYPVSQAPGDPAEPQPYQRPPSFPPRQALPGGLY